MNKEYKIVGLLDFINIPNGKIDACLKDFKEWILLNKKVFKGKDNQVEIKQGGESKGFITVSPIEKFVWIDDGKVGYSKLIIKSGDKEIEFNTN